MHLHHTTALPLTDAHITDGNSKALHPLVLALACLGAAPAALAQATPAPAASAASAPAPAMAGTPLASAERAELEQLRSTTQALIRALLDQGLISRERADALLRQAASKPAAAAAALAPLAPDAAAPAASAPPVVRVPYLPETVKAQIQQEIKNEVLATAREEGWADSRQIPPWARNIRIDGDLRVRAQGDIFDAGNTPADTYRTQIDSPAWSPDLTNTTHARKRLTLRARLGVNAKLSDELGAALRLTTVGSPSQASASQTLGNYGSRMALGLDRAHLRYEPRYNLRFEAGRMAVPFQGSDLLWPDDLSLDGAAVRAEHDLLPGLVTSATLGGFQLEELALAKSDKWLYGLQLGADWALDGHTQLRFGLGYFDFQNVEGQRESGPRPTGARDGTTPYFTSEYARTARQRGNTLININDPTSTAAATWGLASKFKPLNLSAGVTLSHFDPVHVGLSLDYVKNSGFDINDIRTRAGTSAVDIVQPKTTGFQLRGQVGSAKLSEPGNWQTYLAFRKFERDAWLDAFTDTTWHLGGTGYKGFSLGGNYTVLRNTTVGLRWTSTRNLDDGYRFLAVPGDPTSVSGNLSSAPLKIDVVQIELQARF
jgi:hypothetical protein